MVYTKNNTKPGRVLGENVYLDNLPHNSKVFVFYYPHEAVPYIELNDGLKSYGRNSGTDIFVNIGKIGVDQYSKMVKEFQIDPLPVIIVTGTLEVAAITSGTGGNTAFVRIDNKYLLKNSTRTMQILAQIVNLFIAGKIREASERARKVQQIAVLASFKDSLISIFKEIQEVTVGVSDGTFSVKFKE